MEVEQFTARYPLIYHMAEAGTWSSIRDGGLLSTSATLDRCGVKGAARDAYERSQRRTMIDVSPGHIGSIVLRDQNPMPPDRLLRALTDGTTPAEWYALINTKVFFWAQERRLHTLLNARDYRHKEHDVLSISSESLVRKHADRIRLCHMNSGNTWPMPHPRHVGVFLPIGNYPTRSSGKPIKEVVEIVVEYAVPDITNHVVEVWRMRGSKVLAKIV